MSGDLQYFINAKFPKLRVLKLGKMSFIVREK